MAAWGRIGRPCNCVRQGMPRKFRARDCTERSGRGKCHGPFLDSPLPPSMPRNLCGAIVTDATPGLLPRGGGRFHRRRRDHPSPTHLPRSLVERSATTSSPPAASACARCWSCSPARPWATRATTSACWPPPSNSCTPPLCCTTTSSTPPACAAAAPPPMPCGATRRACW